MKHFTLKYYPPKVLLYFIAGLIALNLGLRKVYGKFILHHHTSFLDEIIIILGSITFISAILVFINNKIMAARFLHLLELPDMRGVYEGELISSFYQDDDVEKPNVRQFLKVTIIQNINGVWVSGTIHNNKFDDEKSSEFSSVWSDVEKLNDGKFRLQYLFTNDGNMLHRDNRRYGLNNHKGYACLVFDPAIKTFTGYYFTHERGSHGNIDLTRTTK